MNLNPFKGLPERIGTIFSKEKAIGPLPGDEAMWKSFSQLMGQSSGITQPYSQSVWVYSAVKKIATNISGTPFKLFTYEGDGEKNYINEGELHDLMTRPNPDMTSAELWEATQTYLDLTGNCFWIIERSHVAAIPEFIRVVDPGRMVPAFNQARTAVIGWAYDAGTHKIPFQLHEVLHFKYFNPDDALMGIAPYRCITMVADQDYYANLYNKTFFKEGAAISGFIETDNQLTDKQFSRLLNQINDRHQGVTRSHRIGLLENGSRFNQATLSQKDMDFIEGKKMGKKEIYTAYGTNDVVQGFFEDVKSYEGMKTAMKAFWEGTLIPRTRHLQEAVTVKFFSYIDSGRIHGEFDLSTVSALKEDFGDKVDNAKKLFDLGYSRNAVNKRMDLGMEDDDSGDGDVGYLPGNLLPTDGSRDPSALAAPTPADGDDTKSLVSSEIVLTAEEMDSGMIFTKAGDSLGDDTEEELVYTEEEMRVWDDLLKIQEPLEEKFKSGMTRYFLQARQRTLASMNLYYGKGIEASKVLDGETSELAARAYAEGIAKGIVDDIFGTGEEIKALDGTLLPLYELAIIAGADMVADEMGVAFTFNALDPTFLKWQQMRITAISPEMVNTVEKALRETLTEGIIAKEGMAQLAERVKEVYGWSIARATTIARTESASMIEAGRYQNMINNGIKEHKWFTAMDGEVRTTHAWLHGSTTSIGLKFKYSRGPKVGMGSELRFPTDMGAPAAEVINCRCITLPVIRRD